MDLPSRRRIRPPLELRRTIVTAAALVIGIGSGFALAEIGARARCDALASRAEASAHEADRLRNERDALVAELAQSRRDAAELLAGSEQARTAVEERLGRLEQLVAALVGTREGAGSSPTPSRTPGEGGGESG